MAAGAAGSSGQAPLSVSSVVAETLAWANVGIVIFVESPAVSTGSDFQNMVWALFPGPRQFLVFVPASGRLSRTSNTIASVVCNPDDYTTASDGAASPLPLR